MWSFNGAAANGAANGVVHGAANADANSAAHGAGAAKYADNAAANGAAVGLLVLLQTLVRLVRTVSPSTRSRQSNPDVESCCIMYNRVIKHTHLADKLCKLVSDC